MKDFVATESQKELMNDAFKIVSKVLTELRDKGIPDNEIFNFGNNLIRHYDPIENRRLEKLSEDNDALFKIANDL
mgnify:CR=1 FL=1